MKALNSIFKNTYSALIFLFLYAPIAVLIIFSFNESKSRGSWGGFSLKWYASLFQNSAIMEALANTLIIAVVSALAATVIGTFAAIGINSMGKVSQGILMNVSYLPVLNADIVTGVSLLVLFIFIGIPLGRVSLLLSHITFNIPYVILSVMPKLKQMNKHSYEAALDLGCTPFKAIMKVVLPEIMPGVVTGAFLAFTLSIDDFVISFFTTGPGVSTLSIEIYSMVRRGIKPEINALSSIMFVVVLLLLILVNVRATRGQKKEHGRH
ncbi:MAG: ABC transporter permease [Oscillospiraceae bacterium]|jgi:spermidine/putrescine transport system permease protein|nr:ABC transporter permease [Oscillospiraceae bacterium]